MAEGTRTERNDGGDHERERRAGQRHGGRTGGAARVRAREPVARAGGRRRRCDRSRPDRGLADAPWAGHDARSHLVDGRRPPRRDRRRGPFRHALDGTDRPGRVRRDLRARAAGYGRAHRRCGPARFHLRHHRARRGPWPELPAGDPADGARCPPRRADRSVGTTSRGHVTRDPRLGRGRTRGHLRRRARCAVPPSSQHVPGPRSGRRPGAGLDRRAHRACDSADTTRP